MDEELVFQYLPLDLSLNQSFGTFDRQEQGTVVILLRDAQARWVLAHKKTFYPEGIVRMIGGGINDGEHPAEAATRELAEETGLSIDLQKLVPLVHAEVTGHLPQHQTVQTSIFVFYAQVSQDLQPQDDIDQLAYLSDRDLNDLVKKYHDLPQTPLDNQTLATWQDYGQIWGPVHAAALERVHELGL